MKKILLLIVLCIAINGFSQQRSNANATLAPFYHGVASGDPTSNSVIIWTRVTTSNTNALVNWRMATDTAMKNVVKSGSILTDASKDFTVKADVTGLSGDRYYYYEFEYKDKMSLRGRTKTAPSFASSNVRFAVVSCSNYAEGYFNVYHAIKDRNDVDAVIHLGDYIYEYGNGQYGTMFNLQPPTETLVLSDYRTRYNYYHLDADLIRLHQQYPFFNIWDDHESADNAYTNGAANHTEGVEGSWVNRKAASIRAYHEWLPTRENAAGKDVIYRSVRYGNLGELFFFDARLKEKDKQYTVNLPAFLQNQQRKMLGPTQLNWFAASVTNSTSQWKIIAEQVMLAPLSILGVPINMDQWDGYAGERNRLLNIIRDKQNVVVLSADLHSSVATEIPDKQYVAGTPYTPCLNSAGVEFVVTSVTARSKEYLNGIAQPAIYAVNTHIKYAELASHGFGIVDIKADKVQYEWYFVSTITSPIFTTKFAKAYYVNKNSRCLNEAFVATNVLSSKKGLQAPLLPRKKAVSAKEVSDFTATQKGNKAVLTWKTSTGHKWQLMEVQHATNNLEFTTIGSVRAEGFSGSHQYHFTDNHIAATNYYRIAFKSFEGGIEYSPVAVIKLLKEYSHYWYPNPTADNAKLEINTQKNLPGTLRVYDALGKIVFTKNLQLNAGSNNYTIPTAAFQKGLYVYVISLNNEPPLQGTFIKL